MQMKTCSILFLATLLLACKPEALAETQSTSPDSEDRTQEGKAASLSLEEYLIKEDKLWRKGMAEGVSESFFACIKQNNYASLEISNCASDEKYLQDVRLNKIYKELLTLLSGEKEASLLEAQRSWLMWKNKEELLEQAIYTSEQMDNAELEVRDMNRLAHRADGLEHYKENIKLRAP